MLLRYPEEHFSVFFLSLFRVRIILLGLYLRLRGGVRAICLFPLMPLLTGIAPVLLIVSMLRLLSIAAFF